MGSFSIVMFAIHEVKVAEIEERHLISLVSLWRCKNIEMEIRTPALQAESMRFRFHRQRRSIVHGPG